MPRQSSVRPQPHDRYWQTRIRSSSFKRALRALLTRELQFVSAQRVRDVLDAKLVQKMIREWNPGMLNRELVADLIIQGTSRVGKRVRHRGKSLRALLDRQLVADIDEILAEEMELSPHAEALVGKMMRQEFVRRLFTDIIFTSIVSFYAKVNPLFGAITVRAMEDQIKGFIRLFMPMVQQRAIAFAIDRENQRILFDFARAIVRHLMDEPIGHFAAMVSNGQRRKAEALVRKAAGNADLDSQIRRAVLAAWADLYKAIHDKAVGEVLRLEPHAAWLAERGVEMVLPVLARPHVLTFLAAEVALAARVPQRDRLG